MEEKICNICACIFSNEEFKNCPECGSSNIEKCYLNTRHGTKGIAKWSEEKINAYLDKQAGEYKKRKGQMIELLFIMAYIDKTIEEWK